MKLPMDQTRRRIQDKIFEYCFNSCFKLEYQRFNIEHRNKFRIENSYFVEDLDPEAFEVEFAAFHFYKWIKRLGMKYSKGEIRSFILDKMFNEIEG